MKILVVEDSEEVRCIAVEYLNELGHQAVGVASAEEAIGSLIETPIDLVMTDISLPGISGLELARRLRRDYPRIPIIICSAYSSYNLASLLEDELGAVIVLPKPYDLNDLVEALTAGAVIAEGPP